ncbi:armadillo repeat-containing protein 4 armc4 [Anaeramoeba ignava]|uniref:Armadillo repeat-containing protein 4 armc4 n=1 Tax=Anaeramoeba ignava TaxID=1746090 RepID=A0A9Q0LG16_ANAIG|nr:armadillo repeat-containing protein 4 armc4 [Anaeramoeba ignava]
METQYTINCITSGILSNSHFPRVLQNHFAYLHLFASSPENQPLFRRTGVIKIIVTSIKKNLNNQVIVLSGLSALVAIARDKTNVSEICQHGGLQLVFDTMNAYSKVVDLIGICFELLVIFSMDDEIELQIGEKSGIQLILKLLQANIDNNKLLYIGLRALKNVLFSAQNRDIFSAINGIDVITTILNTKSINSEIQQLCASILPRTIPKTARVQSLTKGTSIDTILETIQKFTSDVPVLESCFASLIQMSMNDEVELEIGKKGGLQILNQAIEANIKQSNLILLGLKAFANLTCSPQNRDIFTIMGGIQTLIHILQNNSKNIDILKFSPKILSRICSSAKNQQFVLENNMIPLFLNLIKLVQSETQFLESWYIVLIQLSLNDDLELEIGKRGGLKVLKDSLEPHLMNPDLVLLGLKAFVNLVSSSQNQQVFIAIQGIQMLVKIINENSSKNDSKEICTKILRNILMNPKNHQFLIDKDVIPFIAQTAISLQSNLPALETFLSSIGQMSKNSQIAKIFGNAQIIPFILDIINNFNNESVLYLACGCLINISCVPENKKLIREQNGMASLSSLSTKFPNNERIQNVIKNAQSNLR